MNSSANKKATEFFGAPSAPIVEPVKPSLQFAAIDFPVPDINLYAPPYSAAEAAD